MRFAARHTVSGLVVLLHLAAQTCAAAESTIQPTRKLIKQESSRFATTPESAPRTAQQWGLTQEEWTRFDELMRGPLGIYSPGLDPLTALGIEARSDDERNRFAELQAIAEGRRAEKILAYQRAYDAAWRRLFPTLRPMRLSTASGTSMEKPRSGGSERLSLFVRENCPACDERAKKLQAADVEVDIYLVGSRQDDRAVRRWAGRVGIDPARVRSETITLNHDAGRWVTLGIGGELPALVREVDGTWQRQ